MPLDREGIAVLQAQMKDFRERAEAGDESAFRAMSETALELEAHGVRPRHVSRFHRTIDSQLEEVSPNRARLGFADVN